MHADLKYGFARGDEAVQFVENIRNYSDILTRLEKPMNLDVSYDLLLTDSGIVTPLKRDQAGSAVSVGK